MKRGSGYTYIRTQEVKKAAGPDTSNSEITARMRDVEQALHRMSQQLNSEHKIQRYCMWYEQQSCSAWDARALYKGGEAEGTDGKVLCNKSA